METVLGFKDFREHERVVAIVRHHWWVLFRELATLAIFFVLPFFLVPIVYTVAIQGGSAPAIPGGVVLFFSALWTLIIWHLMFARWTDYYYDIWIITNWRIIDIDQRGFFRRDVATLLTLDHIEDIETSVDGIIGNLLNFGHVQVQTAGAEREFNIDDVPSPMGVENTIREAQEEKLRVFGAHPAPRREGIYDSESPEQTAQ